MKYLFKMIAVTSVLATSQIAMADVTLHNCKIVGTGVSGFVFDECRESDPTKSGLDGIVGINSNAGWKVISYLKDNNLRADFTVTQTAYGILVAVNGVSVLK